MLPALVFTLSLTVQQTAAQPAAPSAESAPQTQPKPDDQKAEAKEPPTPPHTGIRALFANLVEDVRHLPSKQNLYLLGIGGGLAAAVHPIDQDVNAHLRSHYDAVNALFAPGKYLGNTPEQVALSMGTYAYGRLWASPKASHLCCEPWSTPPRPILRLRTSGPTFSARGGQALPRWPPS